VRKISTALILLACAAAYLSAAVPPVRTMYDDASAKERAVRKALADPDMTDVVLNAVREAVATYESLVRHYPTSSYCDNALWDAARLELDAFARFHQAANRDAAVRLLSRLAAAYPSSKLARGVPDEIARAQAIHAAPKTTAAADDTPARTKPVLAADEAPARPKAPAAAERASNRVVTLRAVHRTVLPDVVRVTLELDGEAPFHDERIANPDRVFLDLASTRPASVLADQTVRFNGDGDAIRQVRIGRHPNSTTRVVLDMNGIATYTVFAMYDPYRLVIECVRAGSQGLRKAALTTTPPAPAAPPVPAAAARAPARPEPLAARRLVLDMKRPPSAYPRWRLSIAEARILADLATQVNAAPAPAAVVPVAAHADLEKATVEDPLPVATPRPAVPLGDALPAPAPPPPLAKGYSMARQLGLGVSRIVIDPGHGGHDPGAKGRGINEADLVLDVALRLEKLLAAVPGVEVILTRRTDAFIPLQDRTAMANRENADLFLSIHANASRSPSARGVETYFLNFANNLSSAAVAARENAASGQAMGALPDFVKAIALNNKLDESRDFAGQVQRAMMDTLKGPNRAIRDLGVKQAPFVVLIGAAMPSVLAEISFVTNSQEAKLLKNGSYRQKIAEALFDAIRRYQTSLKNAQAVAAR